MKVKDYKCKCGHDDFFLADKGDQKGIYCSCCGKWLKWADKNEQNLAMKQPELISESSSEEFKSGFVYQDSMAQAVAEQMATTIRAMNISVGEYENKRNCPFYSELRGMEMILKTMEIEFEYTFDLDVKEITAVTVMGYTVII